MSVSYSGLKPSQINLNALGLNGSEIFVMEDTAGDVKHVKLSDIIALAQSGTTADNDTIPTAISVTGNAATPETKTITITLSNGSTIQGTFVDNDTISTGGGTSLATVTGIAVSGNGASPETKTITLTMSDGSTLQAPFLDNASTGGTGGTDTVPTAVTVSGDGATPETKTIVIALSNGTSISGTFSDNEGTGGAGGTDTVPTGISITGNGASPETKTISIALSNGTSISGTFMDNDTITTGGGGTAPAGGDCVREAPDNYSLAVRSAGSAITLTRNAGSGVVTVPADVDFLKAFEMTIFGNQFIQNVDQSTGSDYTLDFVFQGAGMYNQTTNTLADVELPIFMATVFQSGGVAQVDYEIANFSIPTAGTLRVLIPNAFENGSTSRRLKFVFS